MKTHKDLDAWKNSIGLVTDVYKTTQGFPKIEQFGLTNQIRRSAVSVPSNIAEGAGRKYKKEFIQFLFISLGSLAELETQLIISNNIDYISEEELETYNQKIKTISNQIHGLVKYLSNQVTK
ncbi:MAG: four helix bundle protein [Dysgonamonadaceae bacterium]|nr:four helix bundle protein [Bacteroidales bacterium]MDD4729710.1 four helix bundle protein [Dysgonamonadaceae bacterium]